VVPEARRENSGGKPLIGGREVGSRWSVSHNIRKVLPEVTTTLSMLDHRLGLGINRIRTCIL